MDMRWVSDRFSTRFAIIRCPIDVGGFPMNVRGSFVDILGSLVDAHWVSRWSSRAEATR